MSDRRPFLYDQHVALGAKIVPFGGWEMPLSYTAGTVHEHLSCRRDAVVFDVSHLGTVRCTGPDAFDALQRTLTNDLSKIGPGRAQYTHLLNDDGFVVDDIIVWWIDEETFDVMPNASNTSGVTEALPGVDVTDERCVLAVQGPHARQRLAEIDPRLLDLRRNHVVRLEFGDDVITVAGTGYTGEAGVEIAAPLAVANEILERILAVDIAPAGLGARDTLRLEAGLPLYGHELSLSSTTLEAGLGWVLGWQKETFRGRSAVEAELARGVARHLIGLEGEGRQPLREGAEVVVEGDVVGQITSGNFSPILERGIAMALVERELTAGTSATALLRGREVPVEVTTLPFVRKER